jgi:hypothetical protein
VIDGEPRRLLQLTSHPNRTRPADPKITLSRAWRITRAAKVLQGE